MSENFKWDQLPEVIASDILAKLLRTGDTGIDIPDFIHIRGYITQLPFYRIYSLVRLTCKVSSDESNLPDLYILWGEGQEPFLLEGHGQTIQAVNEIERLNLTIETAPEYLRFFLFAIRGDSGPFIPLEELPPGNSEGDELSKYAKPITSKGKNNAGSFLFEATIFYSNTIFSTVFEVTPNGITEMADDTPLASNITIKGLPVLPEFYLLKDVRTYFNKLQEGLRLRKSTLFILVELLLERSLSKLKSNRLMDHFNKSGIAASSLDAFASLVVNAFPVIAVETSLTFLEETIGQIVLERGAPSGEFSIVTASPTQDDSYVSVIFPRTDLGLLLLPLQTYKGISNISRVAHQLACFDFGAIIACENVKNLPESLRSQIDIRLKLPDIDSTIFETLFNRIFNSSLTPNWQKNGIHWVKHVRHTDFEHPKRMQLGPDQAFDYISGQVLDRLNAVNPVHGLGLAQLHGLGEARQFAEDLIADIHAAIKGQIPWSQVDRGALLVGPPGTGKTTLARAIAKDCGVKFIEASATGWQASGDHLGHHIAAIRRTFAEARSYAPSILFIDEIDSLGSRESFSGQNGAQYLTEVVNSVLEQLQGIDPTAPVFVIAATNHESKVDPALRRSGRLDRIIYIPRPNSESLREIYKHYLANLPEEIAQDKDIDENALGRLSVGLTGADVERIVRGAARRGRKAKRSLNQNDLIAEITNKPRSSDGSPRLSPEEIERTAYHEAGHALAIYLSNGGANDIGFVTIVPREDGKLGFVAQLPDERVSLTRKDYDEKLEIYLAGRAAEELNYGQDNVSGGATNDLQSATKIAIAMVTQLGLAGSQKLLWSPAPTVEDLQLAEKILVDAYNRILQKLKDNETSLKALAEQLIQRQELTGDEVRDLLSTKIDSVVKE
jgi:hypothetical protein